MPALNRVVLVGNLTRDPELKHTSGGTSVCNLGLAVNRRYTTNGEKREEVCYVTCVCWGKTGEIANEYLAKGSPVCIEGRLSSRSWEGRDGQRHSVLEVVVENLQLLERRTNGDRPAREPGDDASATDAAPTSRSRSRAPVAPAPPASSGDPDDDVPF